MFCNIIEANMGNAFNSSVVDEVPSRDAAGDVTP